jgi:VWFA-related protein
MKRLRTGTLVILCTCLAAGIFAWAQIIPGQLPPGAPAGPPKPGQLAPEEDAKPGETKPAADKKNSAAADDDKPTFDKTDPSQIIGRSSTSNVVVPTTVLDPDGHGYVTGLKASDFEVYDNGKPQKIDAELIEEPLSVVLAVQANSEVEGFLPKLKKSANLLHGLVTGVEGDLAILAFDHRMLLLQDFTNDPDKLDMAMQHLRGGSSSSAIIDAVMESSRMLIRHDHERKRRRVIILISRDINKGSQAKMAETIRFMQFESITVYCVDISKTLSALTKDPGYPRPVNGGIPAEAMPAPIGGGTGPHTMTSDAQQADGNALELVPPMLRSIHDLFKRPPARAFTYFTGGRVYNFATDRGLEKAIADIGLDLNSQYVLSYALTADTKSEPGFHNIVVKVDRPGLKIRTRPGYWWGGGQIE